MGDGGWWAHYGRDDKFQNLKELSFQQRPLCEAAVAA